MSTDRPKILYLVTQSELGGAQKYVATLAREMKKRGFIVKVAAGQSVSGDTSLIQEMKKNHIDTSFLPHLVRNISPLKDILAVREIFRLCKKTSPDIIHLNSSKVSVLGSLSAKLAGVKRIIHTVHGFAFDEDIHPWKKYLYRIAEKVTAPFKTDFIFLSKRDLALAKKHHILPKGVLHHLIYNGIDSASLSFLDHREARDILFRNIPLTSHEYIIGTIANLYKTKGIEYFLSACAILRRKGYGVTGAVIGEGPERKQLLSLRKSQHLEKHFFFLGKKENASQYLRAFDIYILSSVKEGLPFSLLEAMAAELPIVASRVGAVPEVLNESSAILVPPKNPEKLAEAIEQLLQNRLKAQSLAQKARERVLSTFTLEKSLKKTHEVYQQSLFYNTS